MRIISLLSLFFIVYSYPAEYWYPVGCLHYNQHSKKIFYIHQLAADNIELYSWDSKTKQLFKELPSHFNPAGFRLLPDKTGFSFVDNGLIKVKYFDRRSPKSLEVYEPVYDINQISWKDNNTCYFHAHYRDTYGIFQLTQQGQLDCIIWDEKADYLYPQVVDDILFYIKRTWTTHGQYSYQVMAVPYPIITTRTKNDIIQQLITDDMALIEYIDKPAERVVYDFGGQPIAYLHMVSQSEGFLVAHPAEIDEGQSVLKCVYYRLKFDQNKWGYSVYILLDIPVQLLFDNEQRLYEGIVPLLLFTD